MTIGERKRDEVVQPERTSGIMKVGGFSPEEARKVFKGMKEKVFDKQEKLEEEVEKTPDEVAIINSILNKMPEFAARFGGTPLPLTPDHFHILEYNVSDQEREKEDIIGGSFQPATQNAVVLIDRKNEGELVFAQKIAHECMHFYGFQLLSKGNEKQKTPGHISTGLNIVTKKQELYFSEVDEAVTEELTKMFANEYFKTFPQLIKEVKFKNRFIEKYGKPQDNELDAVYVNQQHNQQHNDKRFIVHRHAYQQERQNLLIILEQIAQNDPSHFKSSEEVFNVFAGAYFTGKILKVAELVEKTFGKGAFRKLGEETKVKKF